MFPYALLFADTQIIPVDIRRKSYIAHRSEHLVLNCAALLYSLAIYIFLIFLIAFFYLFRIRIRGCSDMAACLFLEIQYPEVGRDMIFILHSYSIYFIQLIF